jgi:glucokinase
VHLCNRVKRGMAMSRYIGVDIGGTNIVFGLVDQENNCLFFKKIPTEAAKGAAHTIQTIAAIILELIEQSDEPVIAVGVGVPGFVDHEGGISVQTVNMGWTNFPFVAELQRFISIPVYINNDVRLYVYGEALAGAGKGYKHVLGVTLGTGIAAAIVNEGQLYYGSGNRAGELGHIPMDGISYPCLCGQIGCLETVASANGIARQAKDAIAQGQASLMQQWFSNDRLNELTAADVSKAYDHGDSLAQQIMRDTGTILAKGLAYAVYLYSPDVIIIGGGASLAGDRLMVPLKEELERLILPIYWHGLDVLTAQRIDDAGIIGSALYAKNQNELGELSCH